MVDNSDRIYHIHPENIHHGKVYISRESMPDIVVGECRTFELNGEIIALLCIVVSSDTCKFRPFLTEQDKMADFSGNEEDEDGDYQSFKRWAREAIDE